MRFDLHAPKLLEIVLRNFFSSIGTQLQAKSDGISAINNIASIGSLCVEACRKSCRLFDSLLHNYYFLTWTLPQLLRKADARTPPIHFFSRTLHDQWNDTFNLATTPCSVKAGIRAIPARKDGGRAKSETVAFSPPPLGWGYLR